MKQSSLRGIALAITGLVLTAHAQSTQYPTILQQPLDQCVPLGGSATYSVVATNATSYQWLFNGVTMDGQTNSTVTVSNVDLTRVGYYSAFVFNGGDSVPTRSAALEVYTPGTTSSGSTFGFKTVSTMAMSSLSDPINPSIVVYGLPIANGGGSGSCPGRYSGYVNYLPPTGWGWLLATNATSYSATDTNQSNTKIEYGGAYGDMGCNQTTVTIPYPAYSPQYRFTTFFPIGSQVPTNAYPLLLTGFQ